MRAAYSFITKLFLFSLLSHRMLYYNVLPFQGDTDIIENITLGQLYVALFIGFILDGELQ